MKVFVLGGTGFLGYYAVLELLRRGHEVTVLALDLPKEDLLPPEVKFKLANIDACSDHDVRGMLAGQDAMVFAIGLDDRFVPPAPAYDFFYKANVIPTERMFRLASESGLRRAVLTGSYFAYFNRIWPDMELDKRHPYIRVRREQAEAAFAASGDMAATVLELPYIFGNMPGRTPLWAPLIKYIASPWPLFYTPGGTTMITVEHVAEAIAGAVERPRGKACYPVGDRDVPWKEMVETFSRLVGRNQTMVPTPGFMAGLAAHGIAWHMRRKGREHGLNPVHFIDLQTIETYIRPEDKQASRQALGFGSGGLEQALEATVAACLPHRAGH